MNNKVKIQSIGTAVPPNKIAQNEQYNKLAAISGDNRLSKLLLRKVYNSSGIDFRYTVLKDFSSDFEGESEIFYHDEARTPMSVAGRMGLFDEFAVELCEKAVLEAMENLEDFDKSAITHLIVFSCTGMSAPGIDIQLIEKLGLKRNVERTCINFMGCYAAINALKSAWYISNSDPEAIVLVAGVELCTLHYQKSEIPDQIVANAIFADGAAAAIVSQKTMVNSRQKSLSPLSFYSEFEPAGSKEMVWKIGDFGFDLRLSAYVPDLIRENIQSLTQKLFEKAKTQQGEIDLFAIHPGGVKILEAVEAALSINKNDNEISYYILKNFGNMSSVTILFVLKMLLEKESTRANQMLLACAFGPGLTMEAVIGVVG